MLNDCMILSCHVGVSEWIHTLSLPECQGTPSAHLKTKELWVPVQLQSLNLWMLSFFRDFCYLYFLIDSFLSWYLFSATCLFSSGSSFLFCLANLFPAMLTITFFWFIFNDVLTIGSTMNFYQLDLKVQSLRKIIVIYWSYIIFQGVERMKNCLTKTP